MTIRTEHIVRTNGISGAAMLSFAAAVFEDVEVRQEYYAWRYKKGLPANSRECEAAYKRLKGEYL